VVSASAAIVGVVDEAVARDGASRVGVATSTRVSTEDALAADAPGAGGVASVSIAGTDAGEFASAMEQPFPALAAAPGILSADENTAALDASIVSATQATPASIDAQTLAQEEGGRAFTTASPFTADENTDAIDPGILASAVAPTLGTTDDIEITSALVVFSPQTLDVTPIVSTDEETSAFEGGVLSTLRGDDIVVDADTRAADTPNIQPADATITEPFVTIEARAPRRWRRAWSHRWRSHRLR